MSVPEMVCMITQRKKNPNVYNQIKDKITNIIQEFKEENANCRKKVLKPKYTKKVYKEFRFHSTSTSYVNRLKSEFSEIIIASIRIFKPEG